jgi:membrane protein required for colicin V production
MNIADLAVIGIVLFTGLVAFSLGLVRMVLALLGWIGAAFATLYAFSYARPFARHWISVPILADAAAGAAIFIGTLIVLTMVSHAIGHRVRGSGLSALDRSLGLVFGFGVGAVLTCLAYLGLAWAIDLPPRLNAQPQWIREARTRPLVEWGANSLRSIAPPSWGMAPVTGGPRNGSMDSSEALRRLLQPEIRPPAERPDRRGYTDRERREMDRLIRGQE